MSGMRTTSRSPKSSLPPLLSLSFVLQHSAEEMLEAETGIGLSAARILSVLNKSTAASQKNIAVELHQTEANVSRQLQNMKKQGLVNITRNKKDSRQRDVTLTAKGVKKHQESGKVLKKQQKQFLRILNAGESAAFETAAQKLA
jgi:DNA-binding MarR family transcriptional regulator